MKQEYAYLFLRTYLENFWDIHKYITQEKTHHIQTAFNQYKNDIFTTMESLTKYPIYRNDFTIFLTSLNRGPYKLIRWETWPGLDWTWFVSVCIHEFLHFQRLWYYKEYIMSKLDNEKTFDDLKESFTFLLSYKFSGMKDVWSP